MCDWLLHPCFGCIYPHASVKELFHSSQGTTPLHYLCFHTHFAISVLPSPIAPIFDPLLRLLKELVCTPAGLLFPLPPKPGGGGGMLRGMPF